MTPTLSSIVVAVNVLIALLLLFIFYSYYSEKSMAKRSVQSNKGRLLNSLSPWQHQKNIMVASDQMVGSYPMTNVTAILYGALIIEEVGETMLALAQAIEASSKGKHTALYAIAQSYAKEGTAMILRSRLHRQDLAICRETPSLALMPQDLAANLLGELTDVVVVVAGLSVAAGLPAATAYDLVARSNMSKINQDTGKMDKTSDGKWIKGRHFRPADLNGLLKDYYLNVPQMPKR